MLALVVIAALAQWIAPYPYDQMHVRDRFSPPNLHYLAGTDEYGRDVFSRLLLGSQLSLALGTTATLISMAVGVPLGLIAGYRRGVTDEAVSAKMGYDRAHDFHRHGAEFIASADMSCLLHMKGVIDRLKLPLKVIHIAQILNGGPL